MEKGCPKFKGSCVLLDLNSIKKFGDKVFYNRLRDYIRPDQFGHLSSIIYIEHNCINFYLYFDQPMGSGEIILINNDTSEWNKTRKGTVARIVGEFACNYQK